MVSDHERNCCHALRACGLPRSPIMSTIGANWGRVGVTRFGPVVSHGLAGVTRFGPVVFHQKGTVWGALLRQKCQAIGDGRHALGSVVSHGRCHAVHGLYSLRSDRGWEGVTHLGPWFPWSPLMSTMVRVRDLHGLRSRATGVGRVSRGSGLRSHAGWVSRFGSAVSHGLRS